MSTMHQGGAVRPEASWEDFGEPDAPGIGAAKTKAVAEPTDLQDGPDRRRDQKQDDEQGGADETESVNPAAEPVGDKGPEKSSQQGATADQGDRGAGRG